MVSFARTNTSPLGRWWWTVDRWMLAALILLIGLGVILSLASSPIVAHHLNLQPFYFAHRHITLVPIVIVILICVSLLNPRQIRRLSLGVFVLSLIFMLITPLIGVEIKGAKRWINFLGFSLQPSEFMKPAFIVVTAWLFSIQKQDLHQRYEVKGNTAAIILYGLVVGLLALQPDFGMVVVVTAVWFGQFFLAGLPLLWVIIGSGGALFGLAGFYFIFPHVAKRIDRFLDPSAGDPYGDRYQIGQSLEAFMNGGLWGVGPGEGIVKRRIPDVHADFIFAVAGEEFGLILCLIIVGIFTFIVLRGISRILHESNVFVIIGAAGLIVQFGLQAIVNMSSTVRLMPTKGMTLPFLSYGGSSMLALAFSMGMVLALTRRRIGESERL